MKAIITGSFDPVTIGHEDIIRRACAIFDQVTVAVCCNSSKTAFFTADERIMLLQAGCGCMSNLNIVVSEGLLAEYCQKNGIGVIVRGVRSVSDFEYEVSLARINETLVPGLETVFLPCNPQYSHISSHVVREMIKYGRHTEQFISPHVYAAMQTMLKTPR